MGDMLAVTGSAEETAPAIELLGESAAVVRAQALLRRAAALETPVLIVAERGIDVESVVSELQTGCLVTLACGDDASAVDRALFGAAAAPRPTDLVTVGPQSRVVAARGGTLFLQDVTELPATVQGRLARLARDGEMLLEDQAVPTNF